MSINCTYDSNHSIYHDDYKNTKYVFKDWTSAVKMINAVDPKLRVDVVILRSKDLQESAGYSIVVFNKINSEIKYKFYVDCSFENEWSLTTDEAIEALNLIGFNCEFIHEKKPLTEGITKILNDIYSLGYTRIEREIRPNKIRIFKDDSTVQGEIFVDDLGKITEYNYYDWTFYLEPEKQIFIKSLLDGDY